MKKPRRAGKIAIAFPTSVSHLEHSLKGIHDYMREHGQWTLVISAESHSLSVRHLKGWDGDGVIAMLNTQADVRAARQLGAPVVNISGAIERTPLPRVRLDYLQSGRLAAETFLNCGFRRFAFYGLLKLWYSNLYAEGFFEIARSSGAECYRHDAASSIGNRQPWRQGVDKLERWLARLPKPIALLAANDRRASMAIDACSRLGLRVPHDVAVMGTDNDLLVCEQCDPPLASIARSGRRIGYEVAVLLDQMCRGEAPPAQDVVIAPEGVVMRASADVLAIDDARLQAAVDFMRLHAATPLNIDHVARAAGVSRRWLEYAFQRTLRRSPRQFLNQLRVERARQLLADASRPKLGQIAKESGFSSRRQLREAVKNATGSAPREFRGEMAGPP